MKEKAMKKDKGFNFKGAKRGPRVNPAETKVQKTIRIDADIFIWLMKHAEETRIPYQTFINSVLKREMDMNTLLKRMGGDRVSGTGPLASDTVSSVMQLGDDQKVKSA